MGEKERAKLIADLDKDGRWFQKAVRRYRTREWARDMRRALGIGLDFLTDETEVSRATLNLAERREATGAVTIGELEALAGAMECKLVYAIVPERGTVAELAKQRKEVPRKPRSVRKREKEASDREYAAAVERIRMASPGYWTAERFQQEQRREAGERQGNRGDEAYVRPPGAQSLREAAAVAMKEMGQEGELAIREKAGRMPWDQPTEGMTPEMIEHLKLAKAEWERRKAGNREQGTGTRDQGLGNREQGTGNREQGTGNRD